MIFHWLTLTIINKNLLSKLKLHQSITKPSEIWGFELSSDNNTDDPSPLWSRGWFQISTDHRTIFHFASVPFKWTLAQRRCWPFSIMFTFGCLFSISSQLFSVGTGKQRAEKIVNIFQELYYYIILCISFMVAFQLFPFLVVIWSSVWSTHNPQSIKIKVHLSQYHSKFFLMSSSYAEWCVILYSAGILKIFFPLCQRQSMSVPPVQKHGQSLDCCTFSAFSFTNWYLWS